MKSEYKTEAYGAWVGVRIISKEENKYEIFKIWVPEKYRRKGIATKMVKEVTDDADNEGVTLTATPLENKAESIGLLKKSGFEHRDEWTDIWVRKPLDINL